MRRTVQIRGHFCAEPTVKPPFGSRLTQSDRFVGRRSSARITSGRDGPSQRPLLRAPTVKPPFGVALNSVGSLRTPTLIRPDNQRAGWPISEATPARTHGEAAVWGCA